jgi:hypothetical protein
MERIVNIHYIDKAAFLNVDIVDKNEEVLTFLESPSYDEVLEETRVRLKWMYPSDQVELVGRYDVRAGNKCRMKTLPIKSNLQWVHIRRLVHPWKSNRSKCLPLRWSRLLSFMLT